MAIKNRLNKVLRKFGVELHGINYLQALAKGDFKNDELSFIKTICDDNEILIYDVGANRGIMIEKFLNCFPNSEIHGFEPYNEFAEELIAKYKDNSRIRINKLGISNEEGLLSFNINKSIDTSSFLPSKKTGLNSDQQVQTLKQINVTVTTIDKYASANNHQKIHLLKLDIQGSELSALKGAESLLKAKKIDFIFAETYFIEQYVKQPSFFDIANYLLSLGYVLQDLYHPIFGKGKIAWCDTLFVREDLNLVT